jgi:hypothetical protein
MAGGGSSRAGVKTWRSRLVKKNNREHERSTGFVLDAGLVKLYPAVRFKVVLNIHSEAPELVIPGLQHSEHYSR